MDDICRQIDEEYYANRERHKDDFKNFIAEQNRTSQAITATTEVATKSAEPILTQNKPTSKENANTTQIVSVPVPAEPKVPLWQRICRGMKHPFRAAWHVVLRVKEHASKSKKQKYMHVQIRRRNLKFLKYLRPSELFLYVLKAKPNSQITCTRLETNGMVSANGNLIGCCSVVVPYGNLIKDGELNEIYCRAYARIVKLSSLNRSYCLCNLNKTCKGYCKNSNKLPIDYGEKSVITRLTLAFDRSCNLCCKSCRHQLYMMDDTAKYKADMITTKLLKSGWLEQTQKLTMAGMGEVFYSPYYRRLLMTEVHRQQIEILSNGTLFNETNWQLVSGKYQTITVRISVDAATSETYQKLRGASFDNLMKNLTMLGELRRQNQIKHIQLNFVVQRDNFREMPDFVRLCKSCYVDECIFQKLNNWKTFTEQTFRKICLIKKHKYLDYELWCVLQDPIFMDPIVDLKGLQRYIDNSEKRYRRRYEREQRQSH